MSAALTATIFYLSAGALVGGAIRTVRSSVERKLHDGLGLALAAGGAIGLIVAIVAFATGPRSVLPF